MGNEHLYQPDQEWMNAPLGAPQQEQRPSKGTTREQVYREALEKIAYPDRGLRPQDKEPFLKGFIPLDRRVAIEALKQADALVSESAELQAVGEWVKAGTAREPAQPSNSLVVNLRQHAQAWGVTADTPDVEVCNETAMARECARAADFMDVLNRCIDNIRELCEDNVCNVPYLRVVMDEIAMIGPMYERAPLAVPYLCDATRFKLSFDSKGRVSALCHFAKELDGRWVALVPAEDDSHMRYAEARK